MSAVRDDAVATLRQAVPNDLDVEPYSRAGIEALSRPSILVKLTNVEPEPTAPQAARRYTFELVLVSALTEAGPADDELEALLEDVLYVLEQHDRFVFVSATRGVYEGTNTPCWSVACYQQFSKPEPTEQGA